MRKGVLIILMFLISAFCTHIYAQNNLVSGIILDANTFKPLASVSVNAGKNLKSLSDSSGIFKMKLENGKYRLNFSRVGYKTQELQFSLLNEKKEFQVLLEPFANQLDQMVIAASRNATQISREVSSLNIVQPYLISNTNANDLSDVLNRVPGVSVIDGQPAIRGGVGYSYNTGSRVAVLLDDMPIMGADLGDVRWNFLPIESAEQIEVIKGSASVLYGSSALNGTVNVRTGWPTDKPVTKFSFYQGINSNPRRKETIWWDAFSSPFTTGSFFSHKQKFGKFDLVWCGNLNANRSHLLGGDNYRARTYFKTRYRYSKNLSFGVNGNIMFEKSGRFFLWNNADSGALRPFNNYIVEDFYRIFSIDPHLDYTKGKHTHAVKLRMYQIHRFVDPIKFPGNSDAIANLYTLDYNYKTYILPDLFFTAGTYNTTLWAQGNVYRGTFAGLSSAAYAQAEYRYRRYTFLAGARYELNGLDTLLETTGLLKRFGINYELGKNTFLRANYSEGYRFPTIGEKYVEDRVSSINIFPNHNLLSEKGFTAEIGIKQGIKIGNFSALIDFAIFNQEFDSMIEFQFGQWINPFENPQIDFLRTIGFKSQNIGQTRAAGYEISVSGEGRIKNVLIRTLGGFTYSMPMNLSVSPEYKNWGNYARAFFESMGTLDSAKYYSSMLAYRNRKLAKWDIEFTYKKFMFGYNWQYYSVYEKTDEYVMLLPGVKEFFSRVGSGDHIHNIRMAYSINDVVRISFLVNNLANKEYATRPGKMDPPRSFNVQLRAVF
jgi:outer membrane cobalamin receptor